MKTVCMKFIVRMGFLYEQVDWVSGSSVWKDRLNGEAGCIDR